MFSQLSRRFRGPGALRRKARRLPQIEGLESRSLLSLTAINFGATVTSTPVAMGGKVFFAAQDGTHGTQLWESDGTAAGTVRVSDGNDARGGINPAGLTVVGDTLFFAANDGHGAQLWRSDGTAAGTAMVTTGNDGTAGFGVYPSDLTAVGGTLFFTGYDLHDNYQLFKSDGTAAGTGMVADINGTAGSGPADLTAVGGAVYFNASDATYGHQLWRSDGTAAGTVRLTTAAASTGGISPTEIAAGGPGVFFAGFDPVHGYQLWASDGTAAGTAMLTSGNGSHGGMAPSGLMVLGGQAYFGANDGAHGKQLWASDGTAAGTTMLTDVNAPAGGISPSGLTAVGGTLFFAADDGVHGTQLWSCAGTVGGTAMVADINGTAGSNPSNLIHVGGALYFTAYTQAAGYQVWQSDGTAAGTVMDTHLNTGSSNVPSKLAAMSPSLFFTAPGATMWDWQPSKTTPTITWPNPASIVYGTALSSTQLDARANVSGAFAYSPAAGTVLGAGSQTLAVTFTPGDSADYTTATATATIVVIQARPTITWPTPSSIVYGTALSSTQLDATANVPGTFTYNPAAGTILGAGNNQALSVTFAPADATDYTSAYATASINVLTTASATLLKPDATTQGTWIGTYGAQGDDVINGSASLPGYAAVTPSGQSAYTWASSTTDVRALQTAGGSSRIAACWYSRGSFTVDVNLTDGQQHGLELYFVDWDSTGRAEQVQISDAASGSVLSTQSISSFHNGLYLDYAVSGHIRITITRTGGANAVLSGLFLDPTSPASS
jgi:ELWxxDGT repeat protein